MLGISLPIAATAVIMLAGAPAEMREITVRCYSGPDEGAGRIMTFRPAINRADVVFGGDRSFEMIRISLRTMTYVVTRQKRVTETGVCKVR